MRRNGWQLPYHPLQVVAIAVFLALGFAFYVFFAPFVGREAFQYVVMGLYTPLVTSVFLLYIWCAATDPGDPGIFKSNKHLNIENGGKKSHKEESQKASSTHGSQCQMTEGKILDENMEKHSASIKSCAQPEQKRTSLCRWISAPFSLICFPMHLVCKWCESHERPGEQQTTEDGMFFCSLCEVEVLKYSKHCRVCDKCVDGFDHHCRWLNNCIGRKNYRRFFILMILALLLLMIQWTIGVLVLVRCILERKKLALQIVGKLGSSFSLVPFIIVVATCTLLAMVATLPLVQLFFFHVLLIKKGISTYDYIVALREQEQEQLEGGGGPHSPQMSIMSSVTGFSSASSFTAFHRGSWCTPPRLFVDDQFDVIPPEVASRHSSCKKSREDDHRLRKKGSGAVKISPWTLARLNAEEVSKAAAQARKKSKVLQPIPRREQQLGGSFGSTSGKGSGAASSAWTDSKRRVDKRPQQAFSNQFSLEPLAKISTSGTESRCSDVATETSTSLAPLQLEARSAFQPMMIASAPRIGASSPGSSLDSPDLHPFRISSPGAECGGITGLIASETAIQKSTELSRSTSDGYEASGGEDSDRIPTRIVHRSSNWANIILNSHQ